MVAYWKCVFSGSVAPRVLRGWARPKFRKNTEISSTTKWPLVQLKSAFSDPGRPGAFSGPSGKAPGAQEARGWARPKFRKKIQEIFSTTKWPLAQFKTAVSGPGRPGALFGPSGEAPGGQINPPGANLSPQEPVWASRGTI